MNLYKTNVGGIIVWILLAACSHHKSGDLVLFDAAITPDTSVETLTGGSVRSKDSVLWVNTSGKNRQPGVMINGNWDLSGYGSLEIKLFNDDHKGELPISIRLENPDADFEKGKGVFVDKIIVPSGKSKEVVIPVPVRLPYPETGEKLFGMRTTPYQLSGAVSNLDPSKVSRLVIYINNPTLNWKWGIKRVVARPGEKKELPAWMKLSPEEFFPFIDQYGQFKYKDWPGKTKSDDDLSASLSQELSAIAAEPGPADRGLFGGWKNGPRQKATGQFYVKKVDGKWWMVDPEGCLYWSHGPVRVTSSFAMTPLDGRKFYFTDLPGPNSPFAQFYKTRDKLLQPYYDAREIKETYDFSSANIYRKYGENWQEKYADMVHKRLKVWGMNTIANGSDSRICRLDKTPYTDRIEIKSAPITGSYGYWWKFKDPFHPEFRANLKEQLLNHKAELDDPWCFGFFVDNEIDWGSESSLAEWTLQSAAGQPAKIEFVNWLKKQYREIEKLNDSWESAYSSWDDLLQSQNVPLPGAKQDCRKFSLVIAEAYFKNIREQFKKVAPDKLYLGCRFSGSNQAVIRIASKYCDVISFNVYKRTLKDFRLPEGVDKPVMVGEFHFGATDRGMFHTGLVPVENQKERAQAFADYIESGLRHPNIIGAHWFQYGDQATTGRFDGENYQIGLVDVCDHPYAETISKIKTVGYQMYEIRNKK
ncbi:MAG: beta-galactosidase [Prolixibacteraceae bacterium]